MLTFRRTNLIVAAELNENYTINKEIYYTEPTENHDNKHDENADRFTCGYCKKSFRQKQYFRKHYSGCAVMLITEKIYNQDFKHYEVTQDANRLELMMPYNDERGLRMYISGPPRCGKSHLIGQLIREYVRHHPKRPIYLFSQVDNDRAIDEVIADITDNLDWDAKL